MALMSDDIAALPRLDGLRFTVNDVCSRLWHFGLPGHWPLARHVRLWPDGAIGGLLEDEERSWSLDEGRLVFLDRSDCRSVVFEDVRVRPDGRLLLIGNARRPEEGSTTRLMREVDPLSRIRSTAPDLERKTKASAGQRRNLVVLRANETSVHPAWPRDIEDSDRNWDLCISFYGAEENYGKDEFAEYQVLQNADRKFEAIYNLFHEKSQFWAYEYIALPDDDIMTSWKDLNALFAACRRFRLDLAQPAIIGNVNQPITRPNEDYVLRYVSFVELMAPIFSRAAFRECVPTFRGTISGYGLDHVWPKLLGEPRDRMAIIDEVAVTHTRPGNSVESSYNYEAALHEGGYIQGIYDAQWRTLEFGGIRREPRNRHEDWWS